MRTINRIILITLIVGLYGLMTTIFIGQINVEAHANGHPHAVYEVLGVTKQGYTHVYADVSYSHSIDKIKELESQIRPIVSQSSRGIYGAC